MMTIGAIGFLQPWIFAALAALPAIWWLLRFTPPSPHVVVFPPTRLLKDLKTTEETPAHSPWWLTVLRMLLAALIILALARPVLNPDRQSFAGTGPLLLIVDNGWASAAHWPDRREAIEAAIDRAGQRRPHRPACADRAWPAGERSLKPPMRRRERSAGLTPQPYAPDRAALATALDHDLGGKTDYSVLWLSDGLDYGEARALTAADCQARRHDRQLRHAPARQRRCGARASASRSAKAAGSPRACSRAEGPRIGVVKARDRPWRAARRRAPSAARRWRQRGHRQFRSAARDPQPGGPASRLPASARPAPCICSTPARNGIASASSRANRARPRSRCCRRSIMCSARCSPYADIITPAEGECRDAVHELIEQKVSTIVLADIGKLVARHSGRARRLAQGRRRPGPLRRAKARARRR